MENETTQDRYVYLFELDSVRKTDCEIVAGQRALFKEIVVNGNCVVLTYNQIVDSRAFFCLLSDEAYYANFIELFNRGKLRISQYGDVRTISQYLMRTTERDKEFIYSALPIKGSQKRLLALIRRSLEYSDLSEIKDFCEGGERSEDELRDLFVEIIPDEDEPSGKTMLKELPASIGIAEMQSIVGRLERFLSLVLRLSAEHDIYVPPRDPKEYDSLKLNGIINIATKLKRKDNDELWEPAVKIIKSMSCFDRADNDRTNYLNELQTLEKGRECLDHYRYAEAIINLCYNYTCEISVCNTSKHYDFCELSNGAADKPTFRDDFFFRLAQDWNGEDGEDRASRYLRDEATEMGKYAEDIDKDQRKKIPDLSQAVRFVKYESFRNKQGRVAYGRVPRYEVGLEERRRKHREGILCVIRKKFWMAFWCIVIASFVAALLSFLQDFLVALLAYLPESVSTSKYLCLTVMVGIKTLCAILFLFASEYVTVKLSRIFPWVIPLGEALGLIRSLRNDKSMINSYSTDKETQSSFKDTGNNESLSKPTPIKCLVPRELKEYKCLKRSNSELFLPTEVYSFADVDDEAMMRRIIRHEELYGCRFGVIHSSEFNKFLVDPVVSRKDGECIIPYERIVPSAGNGVVMVTRCNGNFVLLKQFRHAIRREQFGFPRGFAESGLDSKENARKELNEELGVESIRQVFFLGRLTPDSGISSACVNVYLVDLDGYTPKIGHEGIAGVKEIPCNEFKEWLFSADGTDDAFTHGAYSLFQASEIR